MNSFWNVSETLSRISQTSTVVRPSPLAESDGELQALSAAAMTSTDPPASKRYFTVHLESRNESDLSPARPPDHLTSDVHWTAHLSMGVEGGIDQ
ncbi:protein of unknown function [Streptomyces sp. KY75]|nr:protein of unknown function [Streptomyces sp. KY70]CAD5989614.1 protein of unknown function [Streptomyces sp. KY75]